MNTRNDFISKSLIELTEFDSEYGYMTLDLPSLGLVTVLSKI